MMMMVLPVPAPPKMPDLPPLRNGAIRSMTLTPVSNTRSAWIAPQTAAQAVNGIIDVAGDRTLPIDCPKTLKIRPSVASPTGTMIGEPVSIGLDPARQAVGRRHRHAAHAAVAQILLHFQNQGSHSALHRSLHKYPADHRQGRQHPPRLPGFERLRPIASCCMLSSKLILRQGVGAAGNIQHITGNNDWRSLLYSSCKDPPDPSRYQLRCASPPFGPRVHWPVRKNRLVNL